MSAKNGQVIFRQQASYNNIYRVGDSVPNQQCQFTTISAAITQALADGFGGNTLGDSNSALIEIYGTSNSNVYVESFTLPAGIFLKGMQNANLVDSTNCITVIGTITIAPTGANTAQVNSTGIENVTLMAPAGTGRCLNIGGTAALTAIFNSVRMTSPVGNADGIINWTNTAPTSSQIHYNSNMQILGTAGTFVTINSGTTDNQAHKFYGAGSKFINSNAASDTTVFSINFINGSNTSICSLDVRDADIDVYSSNIVVVGADTTPSIKFTNVNSLNRTATGNHLVTSGGTTPTVHSISSMWTWVTVSTGVIFSSAGGNATWKFSGSFSKFAATGSGGDNAFGTGITQRPEAFGRRNNITGERAFYVGNGGYPSIQSAITDAAAIGTGAVCTINLASNTYAEDLNIPATVTEMKFAAMAAGTTSQSQKGNKVIITGVAGPGQTHVVTFSTTTNTPTVTFKDILFNVSFPGKGVLCQAVYPASNLGEADVVFDGCQFNGNANTEKFFILNSSTGGNVGSLTLKNCQISGTLSQTVIDNQNGRLNIDGTLPGFGPVMSTVFTLGGTAPIFNIAGFTKFQNCDFTPTFSSAVFNETFMTLASGIAFQNKNVNITMSTFGGQIYQTGANATITEYCSSILLNDNIRTRTGMLVRNGLIASDVVSVPANTFTGGDTLTINTLAFINGVDWATGGTIAITMQNIVTAINTSANVLINGVVFASVTGVSSFTIYAYHPGTAGNSIPVTSTTVNLVPASATLLGGTANGGTTRYINSRAAFPGETNSDTALTYTTVASAPVPV